MTDYTPRRYRERYKLEKEGSAPNPYCVKVSALSGVPLSGTDELSNTYWEKYKTPLYDTTTEAFTHAYGWVDASLCEQADLDKNGESCKKAYEELRKEQGEYYKSRTPEERVEPHMEEEKAWEKKLEEAYKAGWETKLQQFSGN
ncbi:hypothetical protein [Microcoleus sp. B3-D7]|uniref:hypothetical protein n=1 Tax=Microcoleus sp. B3-D7 TaxID=2818659 RepID=UPI002FD0B42E